MELPKSVSIKNLLCLITIIMISSFLSFNLFATEQENSEEVLVECQSEDSQKLYCVTETGDVTTFSTEGEAKMKELKECTKADSEIITKEKLRTCSTVYFASANHMHSYEPDTKPGDYPDRVVTNSHQVLWK